MNAKHTHTHTHSELKCKRSDEHDKHFLLIQSIEIIVASCYLLVLYAVVVINFCSMHCGGKNVFWLLVSIWCARRIKCFHMHTHKQHRTEYVPSASKERENHLIVMGGLYDQGVHHKRTEWFPTEHTSIWIIILPLFQHVLLTKSMKTCVKMTIIKYFPLCLHFTCFAWGFTGIAFYRSCSSLPPTPIELAICCRFCLLHSF